MVFSRKLTDKENKILGMYKSMIVGDTEKIESVPLKHILMFAGGVICAGLAFRFGFMHILYKMISKHVNNVEASY